MPDKIQDKDIQDAINEVGTYNEGPGAPPPIAQDAGKIWRGMKEVGGKVALGQSITAAQEGMPMANAAWYVGGGNPQKPLQDVITQSSAAMAPNIPIGIGGSQPSPAQVNPQPWAPLAKEGNKANFDAVYGIPKTPEPSPESKVALPGLPAGQTTAQPVDDNAPNWASKNGWGISGMKIDGVRTAPKTEDRTAVRITDIPSRPFEGGYGSEIVNGKVVSVKAGNRGIRPELATDTSDTTLVSNPNYHKGIVEENGYSHVDNRKYIEVPNENKGGKVPLLEAIGIPKKEPTGIFEKQIFDIKKDPANWKLGTFSPAAQAKIDKLTETKLTTDAHVEAAKQTALGHMATAGKDDIYKMLNYQAGRMDAEQKRAAELTERFRVDNIGEDGAKNINPRLTYANIAENMLTQDGDISKLPKDLQGPVKKTLSEFELELKRWRDNPTNAKYSDKELRDAAWPKWKEKLKAAGL